MDWETLEAAIQKASASGEKSAEIVAGLAMFRGENSMIRRVLDYLQESRFEEFLIDPTYDDSDSDSNPTLDMAP